MFLIVIDNSQMGVENCWIFEMFVVARNSHVNGNCVVSVGAMVQLWNDTNNNDNVDCGDILMVPEMMIARMFNHNRCKTILLDCCLVTQ